MKLLLGAFPLIAVILWTLVIIVRQHARIREALIAAATLAGAWLVAGTELLSLFGAIDRTSLLIWWSLPIAGAVILLAGCERPRMLHFARWKPLDALLLVLVIILLIASGLQAVYSPPTNVDALTYHLTRQVLWAQHRNVAHFSTNNVRQIMMSPYAEFVGLHLLVLTGGDMLHPLIQWIALFLAAVAASLVARRAGARRCGQLLAALALITIPDAFLEASNSKNDVVEAMWVMFALCQAMVMLKRRDDLWWRAFLLGIAAGCAVLTKGTGIFFVGPVVMVVAVVLFRHERARAILPLLLISLIALALNAGHFTRNYEQFGRIAGSENRAEGGYDLVNASKSPAAIASNILRNAAIEAGTPWPSLNDRITQAIDGIHRWLGVDRNDPGLTFHGTVFVGAAYHPHEEDRAGSPAHVLVAVLSPAFFVIWRRRTLHIALLFGIAAAGFLLFCVMLRWQEWNTRLLIPSFCVLAPGIGALWTQRGFRFAAPVVAGLLVAALVPTLLKNDRPLFGQGSVLVTPHWKVRIATPPNDPAVFEQALAILKPLHPRIIGFATGGNSEDYLFMRMALDYLRPRPMFEYVNPRTRVVGSPYSPPDVVIGLPTDKVLVDAASHRTFTAVQQNWRFSVLLPGAAAR